MFVPAFPTVTKSPALIFFTSIIRKYAASSATSLSPISTGVWMAANLKKTRQWGFTNERRRTKGGLDEANGFISGREPLG
jgi:hypothetical protein